MKTAFEWKLTTGRPRKRWIDGVIEDLNTTVIEDCHEIEQDGEKWWDIVVTAKTLRGEEEKEEDIYYVFLYRHATLVSFLRDIISCCFWAGRYTPKLSSHRPLCYHAMITKWWLG